MGTLGTLINNLSTTAKTLTANLGTDQFYVLRPTQVPDNAGGVVEAFTETTTDPIDCFYSVMPISNNATEEQRAAGSAPVVHRKFVCAADVDVLPSDRLRLLARGAVPELELQIVKTASLSGVMMEIVTLQELA